MSKKEEFGTLATKLAAFGDDGREMEFWKDIFDDLEPKEQDELLSSMRKELAALEAEAK